jgi:hypothetical protein
LSTTLSCLHACRRGDDTRITGNFWMGWVGLSVSAGTSVLPAGSIHMCYARGFIPRTTSINSCGTRGCHDWGDVAGQRWPYSRRAVWSKLRLYRLRELERKPSSVCMANANSDKSGHLARQSSRRAVFVIVNTNCKRHLCSESRMIDGCFERSSGFERRQITIGRVEDWKVRSSWRVGE